MLKIECIDCKEIDYFVGEKLSTHTQCDECGSQNLKKTIISEK